MSEDALITFSSTALGAVIALAGAWWMMRMQESTRRREHDVSMVAFRHALRHEADSVFSSYINGFGGLLEKSDEGFGFEWKFTVGNDYFVIMKNNTDRLMYLTDDERKCIIDMYSAFQSLSDVFLQNNDVIEKCIMLESTQNVLGQSGLGVSLTHQIRVIGGALKRYRVQLIEHHGRFLECYAEMCAAFEAQGVR